MNFKQIAAFREAVWSYYRAHGRHDLPWRQPEVGGGLDPYKILVSEIMLQQTQVPRVVPKFQQFIAQFPGVEALAAAPLAEVLRAWSGLGYNRRAKFLWQVAQYVVHDYRGNLPQTTAQLVELPGIGINTAGALLAYAYNQPAVFIETNIRTVFIHHFFAGQQQVSDSDILELVKQTLPDNGQGSAAGSLPKGGHEKSAEQESSVRLWYWALMDYGTHLKQTVGNLNKSSKHYAKQSAFHGSRRQIRGQVLRVLGAKPLNLTELQTAITDPRLPAVLADLAREGLVQKAGSKFELPRRP